MSSRTRSLNETTLQILWIWASTLMLLDALTTWLALTFFVSEEKNPAMAWLIETASVNGFAVVKAGVGVLMVWLIAHIAIDGYPRDWMNRNWRFKRVTRAEAKISARRRLIFVTALMAATVLNNAIRMVIVL